MSTTLVPITDSLTSPAPLASRAQVGAVDSTLTDGHGRRLTDLRVSVTGRCNFRCLYCRTGQGEPAGMELPLAEYERLISIFVSMGIEKVRLTGGEPLLREGLVELTAAIGRMRTAAGERLDLALTTNGFGLAKLAKPLAEAGLTRVTVSLDAVDAETFTRVTRVPGGFEKVLAGIRAAQDAGLGPVKVNCVLLRGYNDGQIEAFAEFARRERVILRFIEFMPLEEAPTPGMATTSAWSRETVVTMDEILTRLNAVGELLPLPPTHLSETARRFGFADGSAEIGIIAPVSHPFCNHCSRLRLTADGKLRTCLFSTFDHDLLAEMRSGATDDGLRQWVRTVVRGKEERHHIGEPGFLKPVRSMVQIGG
ncbi:cyclic pyranopterin monophosphate synthase subunit MoaA [Bryocella elongata]|uniref:GTP 3',8-cyclase n=1 Tax=Bryocella elongata TaxID=863522 RepID=A0A1H5YMB0_9BACT|nr:cyclic pyranopterin monophosphate synthase subunit MoaA [Bryocella elongata]